jgi:hypothetical protein
MQTIYSKNNYAANIERTFFIVIFDKHNGGKNVSITEAPACWHGFLA